MPNISSYNLPLNVSGISNWSKFSEKIQLSSEARSLLEKNGFVVIQTPKDIADNKISSSIFPTDNYAKDTVIEKLNEYGLEVTREDISFIPVDKPPVNKVRYYSIKIFIGPISINF